GVTNQVPVPSDAEIVIEAEVLPNEYYHEGPCGEFTGYMAARTTGSVAKVKAILRRARPIYYDIQPSNSYEHIGLFTRSRKASRSRVARSESVTFENSYGQRRRMRVGSGKIPGKSVSLRSKRPSK